MENNTFNTKETALLAQDGLNTKIDSNINHANDNIAELAKMQEFKSHCNIINLKDFMEQDLPKPEMILDPIIQAKSLTMVHAYRGVGKTFFAMSIAYAVATSQKFLRWHAKKPAKVLYVDGEMQANILQERFAKIAKGFGDEVNAYTDNIKILSADMQPFPSINIVHSTIQEEIEAVLQDDVKLIILDNLSSLTKFDELDSNAWNIMQDWLLDLRKRGIAVLIIHHSGKRGGQRGISKREDILDTVINLEIPQKNNKKQTKKEEEEANYADIPDEDVIFGGRCRVKFEKNRNLNPKEISNFNIDMVDTDNGGIAWLDTYSIVKMLHDGGSSYREIEKITGISKSSIGNILKTQKPL